ncbi:hypothetical protein GF374_01660 [Candidatus Woesearchaeota archaeon]|nr:hypothetical protein [Candidatus Woesearchaeota archaeon]
MSCIDKLAKKMPEQPNFKHAVELINIYRTVENALPHLSKSKRNRAVLTCAKNWLELYSPEQYKFELQAKPKVKLSAKQKKAVKELAEKLAKAKTEKAVAKACMDIAKKHNIKLGKFFAILYKILLNKKQGPRFAPFVMAVGPERISKILKKV